MKLGFMQGRLCDRIDGKIQAFPWRSWESEFPLAQVLGFELMEWTLDQERLYENPLMTEQGQARIRELSTRHGIRIQSLTGDCFMQSPFYKVVGSKREALLADLRAIIDASEKIGIKYILSPLVDNGSLQSPEQEDSLLEGLLLLQQRLVSAGMKILFESDFGPRRLHEFIERLPEDAFGINFDIGNSAAQGFFGPDEIGCYGRRIANVHVKDRKLHGTTVPLGTGNADFVSVFRSLRRANYAGDLILQTARSEDNDHAGALARYRDMTRAWWNQSGP